MTNQIKEYETQYTFIEADSEGTEIKHVHKNPENIYDLAYLFKRFLIAATYSEEVIDKIFSEEALEEMEW